MSRDRHAYALLIAARTRLEIALAAVSSARGEIAVALGRDTPAVACAADMETAARKALEHVGIAIRRMP